MVSTSTPYVNMCMFNPHYQLNNVLSIFFCQSIFWRQLLKDFVVLLSLCTKFEVNIIPYSPAYKHMGL